MACRGWAEEAGVSSGGHGSAERRCFDGIFQDSDAGLPPPLLRHASFSTLVLHAGVGGARTPSPLATHGVDGTQIHSSRIHPGAWPSRLPRSHFARLCSTCFQATFSSFINPELLPRRAAREIREGRRGRACRKSQGGRTTSTTATSWRMAGKKI